MVLRVARATLAKIPQAMGSRAIKTDIDELVEIAKMEDMTLKVVAYSSLLKTLSRSAS